MELLNLDDDALISVLKYLDHESKKQTMLVCKRLEHLIGSQKKLFRNFNLTIDKDNIKCETLKNMRRNFENVSINISHFGKDCFQALEKIAPNLNIPKVKIFGEPIRYGWLVKFVNELPNLSELKLEVFVVNDSCDKNGILQHFEKLVLCQLNSITNCINDPNPGEFFKIPQNVLRHLEIDASDVIHDSNRILCMKKEWIWIPIVRSLNSASIGSKTRWIFYQNFFYNQSKLTKVALKNITIENFEYPAENELKLRKLTLMNIRFLNNECFEHFTKFVKTQKEISELHLDIHNDQVYNGNNYTEILTHLLSLQTLKKVTLDVVDHNQFYKQLRIQNPEVTHLEIIDTSIDGRYTMFLKMFKQIKSLKLNFGNPYLGYFLLFDQGKGFYKYADLDISAINTLTELEELDIGYVSHRMLETVRSTSLKKLIVTEIVRFDDPIAWSIFTRNTPHLEHLEIHRINKKPTEISTMMEHLIETLPHLKVLILGEHFISQQTQTQFFKSIQKYCRKLEYFQVTLENARYLYSSWTKKRDDDYINTFIYQIFPNMQCEIIELKTDDEPISILLVYRDGINKQQHFKCGFKGKKGYIVQLKASKGNSTILFPRPIYITNSSRLIE